MSSLFSFSSGQKDHLILVVVAATTTIFTFRNNASEQYQKNIDIVRNNIKEIPTLFRNFLTLFRKRIFALFQALISASNLKKQPKFAENSLRSLKIRFSSAHFAHLISKVMWAGSQRPTPKSMGQNGSLIFYRNNTEKSRWYCSEYSSEYSSDRTKKQIAQKKFRQKV